MHVGDQDGVQEDHHHAEAAELVAVHHVCQQAVALGLPASQEQLDGVEEAVEEIAAQGGVAGHLPLDLGCGGQVTSRQKAIYR